MTKIQISFNNKFKTWFTAKSQLVFDSKCYELKNYTTSDISIILENSPVINNQNNCIGFINNISHRNEYLYYGDIHIFSNKTSFTYETLLSHQSVIQFTIQKQDLAFNKNGRLSNIVSYITPYIKNLNNAI